MDDFDDERFSRPILSSAPAARHARRSAELPAEVGPSRIRGAREEQMLGEPGARRAVRVRGLDAQEKDLIHDEAQLLASLEIDRITAAPAVLELEEDGYVREAGRALRHRGGRRAADAATPPTGERRALASARESLEELLGALHGKGWVLGAGPGDGLGLRADGTVLVLDLRGLRRDESLSARQADRIWVDSVLQDQDRTLRRRVHSAAPRSVDGALDPAVDAVHADGATSPVSEAPAPPVTAGAPLPIPRRLRRRAAEASSRTGLGAVEESRGARSVPSERSGTSTGTAALSTIRDVLRQPRLRRVAALSGTLVLLMVLLISAGAWWVQDRDAGDESAGPARSEPTGRPGTATAGSPRPAPTIEDPQMLVAELAGARHAYVTGLSSRPASAAHSPALLEDDRIRQAYDGTTVSGGGPVVHSAEVLAPADEDGTAVLRTVTSMQELRVQERSGRVSTIPATTPVPIRLELRWDGTEWCIVSAEPLEAGDPV